FALFAFLRATLFHTGYTIPFHTSTSAGRVTITWATDDARAAGVAAGHRLETVDGLPYLRWGREDHWRALSPDRASRYGFLDREGVGYEAELRAVPSPAGAVALIPIYLACLGVGATYLAIGLLVWLLRGERADSWAFAIFCAAMAAQMFVSFDTFRQT